MTAYLYSNFLENEQEYLALRAFWIRSLKRALQFIEYEPYATDRFNDGTYFLDGNPIASAVNWRKRRAVRIIQQSPIEFGDYYSTWIEHVQIPRQGRGRVPIDEQVIALTMTRESWKKAVAEARNWLDGQSSHH